MQIDLTGFVQVAQLQHDEKEEFFAENNMHNLTNVIRSRSEMGLLSDYPHFYELKREGKQLSVLYATRSSENSEFIISRKAGDFTIFGKNFVGVLKPNFAGTWFELYDFGFEPKQMTDLPKGFLPR
jgi:hypothetical protein